MILQTSDGTLIQIEGGTVRTVTRGIIGHVFKTGKAWGARPTSGSLSTHSTRKGALQHLIDTRGAHTIK